jgi:PelA/Pel-15E family pectate lyase
MTGKRCDQVILFSVGVLAVAAGLVPAADAASPTEGDVVAAMKRASAFMLDTVSYRGGFVRLYTEDLTERWGEVPARETMVWVQDPGTVSVGRVLLEAYQSTGDTAFLARCRQTANALVWGQHPAGGWHYFIDFAPEGIEQWYRDVGTQCWGWEEYYHYYGNCTFDDNTTTGATDFLLDLYRATGDPTYRAPLLKALGFILDAQYPLGGWPQRYPIQVDRLSDHGPGYSAHYTFNDGVTANNIYLLLKAYDALGNEAYLEAARRGMFFVATSQHGAPQTGWAQQYDMRLEPGAARGYEPAGLSPATTVDNIGHLMQFFKITGDTRFLRGIPSALDWLDNSRLPEGHSDAGHTHAMFVEIGTGKPLYAHREGTSRQEGRYWVDYEPGNFPGHYGMQLSVDVDALRGEHDRVAALSPAEAKAEYETTQAATAAPPAADPDSVKQVLDAMDARGAWVEDLSVVDYTDWKYRPRREFRGISTPTFTRNMHTLVNYIRHLHATESDSN